MSIESALIMAVALAALAASPGPAVLAIVGAAMSGGFRSTSPLIMGIVLGDILFLVSAIVGLWYVAESLGAFFVIVKIAGGSYLIWVGVRLLIAPGADATLPKQVGATTTIRSIASGLGITLANPKAILFYLGFLPTFIDLSAMTFFDALVAVMAVSFVISSVLAAYAYAGAQARRMLGGGRNARNLRRVSGVVMVGAGTAVIARA
ncbi:MAG: LysE family translocator [Phycisphaerales bacterium]|nr:MAG: LysE family translocator [Phycisphaerales bacterium]